MIWLLLGIIVFLGIHSVRIVAPGVRDGVIARYGEGPWKGIYSLIALAGFVLLIWGYGQARWEAPTLWVPPIWLTHLNALLMLVALVIFAAYPLPAGYIKRAVKHPMILAVKIWALGHLLANGEAAALLLFGSFLAWAVADRISFKRRGDPVYDNPGVQYDLIAVAIGIAAYLWLVFQGHLWLFGVPPIV